MAIEDECMHRCVGSAEREERREERGGRRGDICIARQLLRIEHTGGADRSMQDKDVVGEVFLCVSVPYHRLVPLSCLCFSIAPPFLSRAPVSLWHLIHMLVVTSLAGSRWPRIEIATGIPREAPPQP